ncbi:lysophospholipid acyltransferase family protein [Candidatus Omnitrophota bacterium]
MINYFFYVIARFLALHLPLPLRYGLARFLADVHFYYSKKDRDAVMGNLKVINPDQQNLFREAREVFRNFAFYLIDFFRTPLLDKEYVDKKFPVVGLEHIDKGLQRGKGIIILTAHIANWELGAVVMGILGYPVGAVALPHKSKKVNDLFNYHRECKGVYVIQLGNAARKSLEAMKDNKMLALAGDRDFTSGGFILDFLGKKALIPKGPVAFSTKTGALIVPGFVVREKEDCYKLIFEEAIEVPEGIRDEEVLIDYAKQCTAIVESYIRRYPTQWLMFRKFWVDE